MTAPESVGDGLAHGDEAAVVARRPRHLTEARVLPQGRMLGCVSIDILNFGARDWVQNWAKLGDNFSTVLGQVTQRHTGKGEKLNTSQAEPVAANSWAVGQFPSISCEAFL